MSLTKDELHLIRREQRISNASTLNKNELVHCIYTHLIVNLEAQLYKFDNERYLFIMRFNDQGGILSYEALNLEEELNQNYYTVRGFVFPYKDHLMMPQEV